MARDKRKGGRTTPKGTRPGHLRSVGSGHYGDASPIDEVIGTGGGELIEDDDPVAAETWASGLCNMFDTVRLQARLTDTDVPPFEEAIIDRCRERRDRRALVVAAALAAVLPPPLDRRARLAADELARSVAGLGEGYRTNLPDPGLDRIRCLGRSGLSDYRLLAEGRGP